MRDPITDFRPRQSRGIFTSALLLLLVVFPYLQFLPSSSYTQPYAFLMGAVLFCMKGRSAFFCLPIYDRVALLGFAIIGVAIFLITCFPYVEQQEYKYLISYLAPLFLIVPLLNGFQSTPAPLIRLLRWSIKIWIFVAVIQKFLDPAFLGALIGQWGEGSLDIIDSGRGVLGLAPEPTHHGFHILLLAASLAMLDPSRKSQWLLFLCVIDAVFFAASSSALLALSFATVFWLFFYKRQLLVIVLLLALGFWNFIDQFSLLDDYRIGQLISAVLENPSSILVIDFSVNMRLGGMIAVINEVFSRALLPFGMSVHSWEAVRVNLLFDLPWLFDLSLVGPPSGIGIVLFQMGFLGLIFLVMMFVRILGSNVNGLGRILLIASPFIFLGQYYLAAPTFALLYASALYRLGNKAIRGSKESKSLDGTCIAFQNASRDQSAVIGS